MRGRPSPRGAAVVSRISLPLTIEAPALTCPRLLAPSKSARFRPFPVSTGAPARRDAPINKGHHPMVFATLAKAIFGSANDRHVKRFQPKVDAINALEPAMARL